MNHMVSRSHVVPHLIIIIFNDFYIDHPGPSTLSNNDSLDSPMMMEEDIVKADGQFKLRRSGWIKHGKSFQNISHGVDLVSPRSVELWCSTCIVH
jgi:hypothetical protein